MVPIAFTVAILASFTAHQPVESLNQLRMKQSRFVRIKRDKPFGCLSPRVRRKASLCLAKWSTDDPKDHDLDTQQQKQQDRNGFLILLTVPVAWATYEPAVRYVYALDPPFPSFLFSCSYFLVAALTLLFLTTCSTITGAITTKDNARPDSLSQKWPTKQGVELGSYLFFGNVCQLLGLQTVPADRAAFLLQVKAILVPLLGAAFARKLGSVSLEKWIACSLAFIGVCLMELDSTVLRHIDGTKLDTTTAIDFGRGDALVVTAAAIYSLHILRLEKHAKEGVSALKLAAVKATTECTWACLVVAAVTTYANSICSGQSITNSSTNSLATVAPLQDLLTLAKEQGSAITAFLTFWRDEIGSTTNNWSQGILPAFAAILWTGLVTIAYTIFAQTVGQKTVSAVTANLIYMIQPICTAVFAWILLGERLGPQGYLGAALLTASVLLAKS